MNETKEQLPLTLEQAKAQKRCRICGFPVTPRDGWIYNGGSEYAHTACLAVRIIDKEQPMPDPKPEPLVKWPEEELEYGQLEEGDLFVPVRYRQIPCVKTSDSFMVVNGENPSPCVILTERCKVRRIRFNQANKEPVYIVI